MKVGQLINLLRPLPQDAEVHLDDEGYPTVDGVYSPDDYKDNEDGDPEDAPPSNVVLIEFSRNEPD